MQSSTGIHSRTAAALAYSGWWITGAIFWLVERSDPYVRRHAAQALVVFGLVSMLIVVLAILAVAALSFLPAAFGPLTVATGVVWLIGVLLWVTAMWRAANGREWGVGGQVLRLLPEHPSLGSLRASAEERA